MVHNFDMGGKGCYCRHNCYNHNDDDYDEADDCCYNYHLTDYRVLGILGGP